MFESPVVKAAAASLARVRSCDCPRETSQTALPRVGTVTWLNLCPHEEAERKQEEQEGFRRAEREGRLAHCRRFYDHHMPPLIYRERLTSDLDLRECSKAGVLAARRYVETWAERRADGQGLTFTGDIGTGKSLVAAVIANEVCQMPALVLFATVTDFQTRMKQFDSAAGTLDDFKRADLVVLDDFGQERATEWAASHLFDLVDARTKDRRPTIITTNLGARDLRDHYIRCLTMGKDKMPADQAEVTVERILSRIRERNASVVFEGADQRADAKHDWLDA